MFIGRKNFKIVFLTLLTLILISGSIFFWLDPKGQDAKEYNSATRDIMEIGDLEYTDQEQLGESIWLLKEAENKFVLVAQNSKDPSLRAKANYNLAIIIATQAFVSQDIKLIDEAQERLQASLRDDDKNMRAKLYLEFILKMKQEMAGKETQNQVDPQNPTGPGKPSKRLSRP